MNYKEIDSWSIKTSPKTKTLLNISVFYWDAFWSQIKIRASEQREHNEKHTIAMRRLRYLTTANSPMKAPIN